MGVIFFKINKHKSYNYKPVFYDPDKDKETLTGLKTDSENPDLDRLRSKMKAQWHAPKKKKIRQKYPVAVIAFIIALLFTLVYWIFKM